MSQTVLITVAMIAAAATIEEAIKLGTQAIEQRDAGIAHRDAVNQALSDDLKKANDAHEVTKEQSASIINDLKDQLNVANANIGSELPIISYKGKKYVVAFIKFHLPKDNTQYTLEDLKQGKKSDTLIEKILAIKGQTLLSEAVAGK